MRFLVGLVIALGLSAPAHANDMLVCATARTNPEEAAAACSRLIESGTLSPQVLEGVLTQRSLSYLKQHNYDGAASDITRLIDLNPGNPVTWANRGFAYIRQGKFELALADYNRAIDLHPSFAAAYHNRGAAHIGRGQLGKALTDFDIAVTLGLGSADAHADRGIVLAKVGKLDLAVEALNMALRLDAISSPAHLGLGLVALRTGDYAQAITRMNNALKYDPENSSALSGRGVAYQLIGKEAKASADFQAALKLNKTRALARFNTALYLLMAGLRTKALAVFKSTNTLNPDLKAAMHNALCWDLAARHQVEEALAECETSNSLRPSNPATLDSRAFVYWLMDKPDDARRDLEAAKAIAPQLLDYENRFTNFKVAAIEGLLLQKGFQPGIHDGHFDPHTKAAIEAYQTKFGLAVTGEPNTQLLDHLRQNTRS